MKKLLFTSLLAILTGSSFGQTINFGLKAGANWSEQIHSDAGDYRSSYLAAFNVGSILNINFHNFAIQPGLFFTEKGEKDVNTLVPLIGSEYTPIPPTTTLDYIELPLDFLYIARLPGNSNIHFGAGPYIAYCIHQTLSGSAEIPASSTEYQQNAFKKPDYGLNGLLGVTLNKHFLIEAGVDYGLANIDDTGYDTKNLTFSLSAGYMFR